MIKKRTFGYNEFKLRENLDKVGFNTVAEYEDETSIDDLGEGEEIDLDAELDTEEAPEDDNNDVEETELDLDGSVSTVTLETINTYLEFINKYISSINGLVKKAESVPLDKATENKILAIYKVIQGI